MMMNMIKEFGDWLYQDPEIKCKFIQRAQRYRNKFLDQLFYYLSFVTEEEFCLPIFLPILWGPLSSVRLAIIVTHTIGFAVGGGNMLKNVFAIQRPDSKLVWKPDNHHHRFSAEFGFPSTHTSHGFTFSMGFAYYLLTESGSLYDPWSLIITALMILTWVMIISFSRIYLGAHSLQDVVGGWLLGFISGIIIGPLSDLAVYGIPENSILFYIMFLSACIIFHYHPINRSSKLKFHFSEGTSDQSAPSIGCVAGGYLIIFLGALSKERKAPNIQCLLLRYAIGLPISVGLYFIMRKTFPIILEKIFKLFNLESNFMPYSKFYDYLFVELEKSHSWKEEGVYNGKLCRVRAYAKFFQYVLISVVLGFLQ